MPEVPIIVPILLVIPIVASMVLLMDSRGELNHLPKRDRETGRYRSR